MVQIKVLSTSTFKIYFICKYVCCQNLCITEDIEERTTKLYREIKKLRQKNKSNIKKVLEN